MNSTPITDESLEDVLQRFRALLQNLAQRPTMVLVIRSDARVAAVPAWRHVRRFLGFIQENGSEFVLVGRGSVIVLGRGVLASALLGMIRMVQRLLPAPWPESTVNTMEEAQAFLSEITHACLERAAEAARRTAETEASSSTAAGAPSSTSPSRVEEEILTSKSADSLAHGCESDIAD